MPPLLPGEPVLVTGLDGPLAQAIARRLASDCPTLVLAAPAADVLRREAAAADEIRAHAGCAGKTHALVADPALPGQAGRLLADAAALTGPIAVLVVGKRVDIGNPDGDGAPVLVTETFDRILDAVAAMPAGGRPRAIVLAARAFPPLDAADAHAALAAVVAQRADALKGIDVHVFAAEDPHAGAAASAFGLMDRPFGADIERARRRLESAADAVHALLAAPTGTVHG
jgi:hypothetical protein